MNLIVTPDHVDVELTTFENVAALRRDIRIPRSAVTAARVDPDPLRSIRGRFKYGLRIPGRLFVCGTEWGRHFWAIRRGVPAVTVSFDDGRKLREVTVSTPRAAELAAELSR